MRHLSRLFDEKIGSIRSFFGSAFLVAFGLYLLLTPGVLNSLFLKETKWIQKSDQLLPSRNSTQFSDAPEKSVSPSGPEPLSHPSGEESRKLIDLSLLPTLSVPLLRPQGDAEVSPHDPVVVFRHEMLRLEQFDTAIERVPLPRARPRSAPRRRLSRDIPPAYSRTEGVQYKNADDNTLSSSAPLAVLPQAQPYTPSHSGSVQMSGGTSPTTPQPVSTISAGSAPKSDSVVQGFGTLPVPSDASQAGATNLTQIQLAIGLASVFIGITSMLINVVFAVLGPDIRDWVVARRGRRRIGAAQTKDDVDAPSD
jgi:hypothetical protein